MSDSREESPDWLREFQPPTRSAIELSSGSESPLDQSPVSDDEDNVNLSRLFKKDIKNNDDGKATLSDSPVKGKSPNKGGKVKRTPPRKRKKDDDSERGNRAKGKDGCRGNTPENLGKSREENTSIWSLSSDSESSPDARPVKKSKTNKKELSASKDFDTEDKKENYGLLDHDVESLKNQAPKVKSPVKKLEKEGEKSSKEINTDSSIKGDNDTKDIFMKEDISGKRPGHQVSSSRVPLLLSEKVQRSKALVECEGDSIDLSGDMGSVGRVVIADDSSKKHEMFLDIKGTIYKTTIVPSRTFCVVSFGQSEAKIEAIMNDYIQLKPQSNIYESETMVEGTLDGFSFDSDEEADKTIVEADQQEAAEEQPADGKTKKKPGKKPGLAKKKGKPTGEKPAKKVMKRKPQLSKKGKTKK
ncbi:DNA-binding protein BIN4 [Salvia miltiorrhiza]|uniref:DNA-binding protein BIN4 n=1 Tax=Salvia miltiorrhiza TaxID=226208 RepID=UPI0025ACF274|nr:DNA-binding protein BIN4 [Salvia miltiorrhiza]